jgi:hypothetical protein
MANDSFSVLSPWAEADPVPARGISPRVTGLAGKKIGLLHNSKRSAEPILSVVESKLKVQIPVAQFSHFINSVPNEIAAESTAKDKFEDWVKSVDAVVAAVGD